MDTKPKLDLTARDLSIIKLTALGQSRKEIADQISLSIKTLEYHLAGTNNPRSIANKLGLRTPAEITRFALEHGLVKPGEKPAPSVPRVPSVPSTQPVPVEITGIEDLKRAILRGATLAANNSSDVIQVNSLVQCSDAYIRLARLQLDAALNNRLLTP